VVEWETSGPEGGVRAPHGKPGARKVALAWLPTSWGREPGRLAAPGCCAWLAPPWLHNHGASSQPGSAPVLSPKNNWLTIVPAP
jgi:hypothetical protein